MTKPYGPIYDEAQRMPSWVEIEAQKKRKPRVVKSKPWECKGCWHLQDSGKPPLCESCRKAGIKAGQSRKPKLHVPDQPRKPKLHVKVNLTGSVEFDLEGDQAAELASLLNGMKLDEVLEFVDPWASGAEIRYDVQVTDPERWPLGDQWEANETTGTIELRAPDLWLRPY